jgi:hypothetical protein
MLLQLAPYFGYLASLALIFSLLANSDIKFRWWNIMGTIFFIVYSLILNAIPVLLTNGILFIINFYYLVKIYGRSETFDVIEFKGEEKLVDKFLSFYNTDIKDYFPGFTAEQMNGKLNFVVLRDVVIANMFSAEVMPNGDAEIILNYTTQKYRDYKVGTYLFDKEKQLLINKGIKRIVYKNAVNKKHQLFLKKMGFQINSVESHTYYQKDLLP